MPNRASNHFARSSTRQPRRTNRKECSLCEYALRNSARMRIMKETAKECTEKWWCHGWGLWVSMFWILLPVQWNSIRLSQQFIYKSLHWRINNAHKSSIHEFSVKIHKLRKIKQWEHNYRAKAEISQSKLDIHPHTSKNISLVAGPFLYILRDYRAGPLASN